MCKNEARGSGGGEDLKKHFYKRRGDEELESEKDFWARLAQLGRRQGRLSGVTCMCDDSVILETTMIGVSEEPSYI
jgi:hypothetical protein